MKQKRMEEGKGILAGLMNHWILAVAAVTLMGICQYRKPRMLVWIAAAILPAYLYEVRLRAKKIYLFFLLHLLPIALAVCIPLELPVKLIFVGLVVVHCIISIRNRLDQEFGEILVGPIGAVCTMGELSFFQKMYGSDNWDGYYMIVVGLYFACYFIHYFIQQYLHFILVNKSGTTKMPEREIFFAGIRQTAAYTIVGVLVLFLTANVEWVAYVLSLLKKGGVAVLQVLVSFLKKEEPTTSSEIGFQGGSEMPEIMPQIQQSSSGWEVLEFVVALILGIALMILLFQVLRKAWQYLWDRFHEVSEKSAELNTKQDVRESCFAEKTEKEKASRDSFLSNRGKVRRAYKKQVLKKKEAIVGAGDVRELEHLTAKECCEKISAENLQTVYEKARYSRETVTAEDIRKIQAERKANSNL